MKLSLSRLRVMALGGVVLCCAAFTGATFAQDAKPYSGTQISLLLYSDVGGNAARKLIETERFQKLTGIKVDVSMLSWENSRQKILLGYSAKDTSFDALYLDNTVLSEFASRGMLEPLGKYMKDPKVGDPQFNLTDFPKQLLPIVTYGNDTYGLPYTISPTILMYRKDLFGDAKEKAAFKAKYGYDLVPPQTMTQFRDAAEFFTRKGGGQELYGVTTALKRGGFAFFRWKQYAHVFGGGFYDAQGKPKVDSPQNIQALEYLIGLRPFMPPTVIEMTGGESGVYFSSGRAAMTMEYTFYAPPAMDPQTSKIVGKVGFATAPKGNVQAVGHGGTILSVYSLSKHKEAAYKLIEWLCSVEGERMNMDNGVSPLRLSLARDPKIQERLPWLPVEVETNLRIKYADPINATFPTIWDTIGEEVNAAYAGAKSAKQALTDAQARIERMIGK